MKHEKRTGEIQIIITISEDQYHVYSLNGLTNRVEEFASFVSKKKKSM